MAIYPGGEQVDAAQNVLERHAVSSADGRCLGCRSTGPCAQREAAVLVFTRTLRLPSRRPGATRPELIGARRVAMPTLFSAR